MSFTKQIVAVYNALQSIETHGQSTIIMAGCLNALSNIVDAMTKEDQKQKEEE